MPLIFHFARNSHYTKVFNWNYCLRRRALCFLCSNMNKICFLWEFYFTNNVFLCHLLSKGCCFLKEIVFFKGFVLICKVSAATLNLKVTISCSNLQSFWNLLKSFSIHSQVLFKFILLCFIEMRSVNVHFIQFHCCLFDCTNHDCACLELVRCLDFVRQLHVPIRFSVHVLALLSVWKLELS